MVLYLQFEKLPLKKGKWSAEEDQALITYIKRYGIWNWNQMPKAAGLLRSGKSCRLRWVNYLKPNLKHGNFTEDEDEIILALHQIFGNKWSVIAAELPGRSDNEIKNRWNSYLKKRLNNKFRETKPRHRSKVQRKEAKSAENQISYFTVVDSSSNLNLFSEDKIVFSAKFYQHLDHYLQDQETNHTDHTQMLIDDENISTSPSGSSTTSSNSTMWPCNQMNEEINVGLFTLSDELVPNMWEEQPFLMDYV